MSIQLFLSNCSLDLFYLLALFCMFFFVLFSGQQCSNVSTRYVQIQSFPCSNLFSLFRVFSPPKEVCEELGFFCRKLRTLEIWQPCQALEFVRFACQKSVLFLFAFFYYVFFSCDNTRYRCVWRCDISVSVVAVKFCSKH